MPKEKAIEFFNNIRAEYDSIPSPKYRNVDLQGFKQKYQSLSDLKEFLKEDPDYLNLLNAMSQIISKLSQETTWTNVSERSVNKVIPPVMKKGKGEVEIPFEWTDRNGQLCLISGYWGPKNYMVMDVLAYFFLLKEGGDSLPQRTPPLFDDLDSIKARETELDQSPDIRLLTKVRTPATEKDIALIKSTKYWVRFDDMDLRRFTSVNMSSNEILKLLHDTARVEFKISFPVRMESDGKKAEEKLYQMNFFSSFFEFGYIDKETRKDGIVQKREYYITFNTMLGELFVNNLKTYNFDWLGNSFYHLPDSAQILYRRLLVHHDYTRTELNLDTIAQSLKLQDKNVTNLMATIETNALEPLKQAGLIESYEKKEAGLHGPKYIVHKPAKKRKQIGQGEPSGD